MKTFLITEEQRNALLVYLSERPYKEVAKGVEMLQLAPEWVDPRQTNEAAKDMVTLTSLNGLVSQSKG